MMCIIYNYITIVYMYYVSINFLNTLQHLLKKLKIQGVGLFGEEDHAFEICNCVCIQIVLP